METPFRQSFRYLHGCSINSFGSQRIAVYLNGTNVFLPIHKVQLRAFHKQQKVYSHLHTLHSCVWPRSSSPFPYTISRYLSSSAVSCLANYCRLTCVILVRVVHPIRVFGLPSRIWRHSRRNVMEMSHAHGRSQYKYACKYSLPRFYVVAVGR